MYPPHSLRLPSGERRIDSPPPKKKKSLAATTFSTSFPQALAKQSAEGFAKVREKSPESGPPRIVFSNNKTRRTRTRTRPDRPYRTGHEIKQRTRISYRLLKLLRKARQSSGTSVSNTIPPKGAAYPTMREWRNLSMVVNPKPNKYLPQPR